MTPLGLTSFDHARLAADATEIHRDLGMPAAALRWNNQATMATDTYARSHALRLAVLGSIHLQDHSSDLDLGLQYGHQTVDVLTRVTSARALDYLNDLHWRPDTAASRGGRTLSSTARLPYAQPWHLPNV